MLIIGHCQHIASTGGCLRGVHTKSAQARVGTAHVARASNSEELPGSKGDWRAFRAALIAQSEGGKWNGGIVCDRNLEVLREQNPSLAEEAVWAHPIGNCEAGAVLLASNRAPSLLKDPRLWQLVVLILEHNKHGSRGLILNRPALVTLGDILQAANPEGDLAKLGRAFHENVIYLGGMYSPSKLMSQKLTMLHPHEQLLSVSNGPLNPAQEVVPGIVVGGEVAGAASIEEGALSADSFRFFAGMLEWGPGQLSMEVKSGIWEIMELLGGDYLKAAQQGSSTA